MVPLMSDSRVMFLIWFVSVAIVVAVILVIVEIRVRGKKEREAEKKKESTPIENMKIILSKHEPLDKKLDAVGKTAKDYFKEEYGMSLGADYSELAKEFEAKKKKLEVEFCKGMFELYYSDKGLTEEGVGKLGNMLIDIYRKKNIDKEISKVPSFWGRIGRIFWEKKKRATKMATNKVAKRAVKRVVKTVDKHNASNREKEERVARVSAAKEHEYSSWVKKAIRMGYDRPMISKLLDDGNRDGKEVKAILRIYDEETGAVTKKKDIVKSNADEGGIAQRIVQKGRESIEE